MNVRAQTTRVPVIMYHDVIKERGPGSQWFDVTEAELEQHLQQIASNGGSTLSMDQLYRHLTDGEPVPPNSVVLTFDDNYQGVHDFAVPLLRKYNFKATVFVHTGFVGSQQGRPKMTWDTLRALVQEGVIEAQSHTVTHPEDLRKLTADQQRRELEESKRALEKELGTKVEYLSYPIGNNDEVTREIARQLGYKMAFTMESGPAQTSPDILRINRYEQTKFMQAWEECQAEIANAPLGVFETDLNDAPVTYRMGEFEGVRLVIVTGGKPTTVLSDTRQSVGDFVRQEGASAGINGTFFSMAAIKATDNRLVGPSRIPTQGVFLPDNDPTRVPKLKNRPLVLWNGTKIAIVPFQPNSMNREEPIRTLMPDYTDLFLGGAWIVRQGVPRSAEQMRGNASQDIQDYRRRAFFGVTVDGTIICGASKGSVTTERLAQAASAAGAYEAVLLDSGFSTSLVFDGKVLATGHSTPETPSRPVPHAIVLHGLIDPNTDWKALEEEKQPETKRGRRNREVASPWVVIPSQAEGDKPLSGIQ